MTYQSATAQVRVLSFTLLAGLLMIANASQAAQVYYVDYTNGNNDWLGTQPDPDAQTQNGPWKTIGKVNASVFQPGDSILFKCGETWREQLTVPSSGMAGSPVTFGSYPANCSQKPIINAANTVENWNYVGDGVYTTAVGTAEIKQVFIDGVDLTRAHYPASGFLTITANTELTPNYQGPCQGLNIPYNYITDATLTLTNEQVAGAKIHIRTNAYIIDDYTVSSWDASQSRLNIQDPVDASCYQFKQGWGYYLSNRAWMLSQGSGWAQEAGQVYVRLPNDANPAAYLVEISIKDSDAVTITNKEHITVKDIAIRYAGRNGVYLYKPGNFNLTGLDIAHSGVAGIWTEGPSAPSYESGTIQNCTVVDSRRRGIYTFNQVNMNILDNTVSDTGTQEPPVRSYGGIWSLVGDGHTIRNNQVSGSGYMGIRVHGQNDSQNQNALIQNNVVEDSCLVLDDCAAIYSQGYLAQPALPKQNSLIDGNIVINATGNSAGRQSVDSSAQGIYLDDYSNFVTVTNNTVVNADWGVFLHNAQNNTIANNTLFQTRKSAITLSESGNYTVSPKGVMHDNVATNNTLFPLSSVAAVLELSSFGTSGFATYDWNTYTDFYSDTVARILSTNYNWQAWQEQRAMEANGLLFSPFKLRPHKISAELSAEMVSNGGFDSGVSGWFASPSPATPSWEADCGLGGGCYKTVSNTTGTSKATSNQLSVEQGKTYAVEFKIASAQDNQNVRVLVRRWKSPFEAFGLNEYIKVDTARTKYQFIFTATTTAIKDARIDFELKPGQTLYLDNVSMKEVTVAYKTDASDDMRILVNKSSGEQAFDCPDIDADPNRCDSYIDLNGALVAWPVTVPAYRSQITVWAQSPFGDADRDYVADEDDACPNSTEIADTNAAGCGPSDLSVTLTSSADTIQLGDEVQFTATVSNLGPDQAGGVNATLSLPSGLTLISATATQGVCTVSTANAACSLGAIANGGVVSVTGIARADAEGAQTSDMSVSGSGIDNSTANNNAEIVSLVNTPPTVTLSAPLNGSIYQAGASVTLTADATDLDGGITRVEFYSGAHLLGSDDTSPYSLTVNNVTAGSYSVGAVAIDNNNGWAVSNRAYVIVNQ